MLNVEWQTGERAFDDAVYVSTPGHSAELLSAVLTAEVRGAVMSLFALGFRLVSIDDEGVIRAKVTEFVVARPRQGRGRDDPRRSRCLADARYFARGRHRKSRGLGRGALRAVRRGQRHPRDLVGAVRAATLSSSRAPLAPVNPRQPYRALSKQRTPYFVKAAFVAAVSSSTRHRTTLPFSNVQWCTASGCSSVVPAARMRCTRRTVT